MRHMLPIGGCEPSSFNGGRSQRLQQQVTSRDRRAVIFLEPFMRSLLLEAFIGFDNVFLREHSRLAPEATRSNLDNACSLDAASIS